MDIKKQFDSIFSGEVKPDAAILQIMLQLKNEEEKHVVDKTKQDNMSHLRSHER